MKAGQPSETCGHHFLELVHKRAVGLLILRELCKTQKVLALHHGTEIASRVELCFPAEENRTSV